MHFGGTRKQQKIKHLSHNSAQCLPVGVRPFELVTISLLLAFVPVAAELFLHIPNPLGVNQQQANVFSFDDEMSKCPFLLIFTNRGPGGQKRQISIF
jgi:hypothetical protein